MKGIGEGIAFAGLCAACAYLEIYGKDAGWLWVLVVFWAILTNWGQDKCKKE